MDAIVCYLIFINIFLRTMMLVIVYLINHTSCLYPGTVLLWETARVAPFHLTAIIFTALMMFSTRSELQDRSVVEQLYNNKSFLRSNLISLMFFFNKTSLICFSEVWLNIKPLFCDNHVVWYIPCSQYIPQTGNANFVHRLYMNWLSQSLHDTSIQFWNSRV